MTQNVRACDVHSPSERWVIQFADQIYWSDSASYEKAGNS